VKLQVVQADDRAPITEIDTDDAAALEAKLATATRVFADRSVGYRSTNVSMCCGGWPRSWSRAATTSAD
jgi:hypothetical protein